MLYIELLLECYGVNGINFNIVNLFYFIKVGDGFGFYVFDDVLVIIFFEFVKGWDGFLKYFGICMYLVKEINEVMMFNFRNCINKVNVGEKFGFFWVFNGD